MPNSIALHANTQFLKTDDNVGVDDKNTNFMPWWLRYDGGRNAFYRAGMKSHGEIVAGQTINYELGKIDLTGSA